ncbi:GNAT family N-acetyltransferase [Varibaculum prostatecancerukia]|uniref:GNAT family N-acetyltransferase n=1 Tax=Varibaculum prostatecancerukia TaxID=2811781 RepID=UPI001C008D9B|nr:GNAT family protein [Varibaculum prostatecancerukia]
MFYRASASRLRARYRAQLDNPVGLGLIKPGNPPIKQLLVQEMNARDHRLAAQVRADNHCWLAPWEASAAPGYPSENMELRVFIRRSARLTRKGRYYSFAVWADGKLVGQISIGDIARGASHSGNLGYWVAEKYSGRGVITTAVAMVLDLCLGAPGLHRVEINLRPENKASRRVVEKLGLRFEGRKRNFYFIAGQWADHLGYAATAEEIPAGGYLAQLKKRARLKAGESVAITDEDER